MDDSDQSRGVQVSRRAILGATGATVVGGVAAAAGMAQEDDQFALRQGDECVPITPLAGSDPVEEFYDYRLPEHFASAENGGSDPGSGPYYSSLGTEDLQRDDTSIAFLYDGPEGLSLVVVHGSTSNSPNGGGAATFEVAGIPDGGEWVVKDDLYRDESGDLAATNYDRWDLDGETDTIDWTWASNGTDGGALRGLSEGVSITIRPRFNERATLFQQYYEGTVDAWQFLTPDGDGVDRVSLDMATPITVHVGPCGDAPVGDEPIGDGSAEVETVEFKGCGAAWIVFDDDPADPVPATVETSGGDGQISIAPGDLTTVPGQFGEASLYKWSVDGSEKVLAVEVDGGRYENDHRCTEGGDGGGNDGEQEHHEDDGDRDDEDDDGNERGGKGTDGKGGEGQGNGPPDHARSSDDDGDDDDDDDEEEEGVE